MSNQFDDVSKGIASGTSRRGMFKMLGVGVVGAVATAFGAKSADAAGQDCLRACRGLKGALLISCTTACSCESNGYQVCGSGTQRKCCSPRAKCIGVNQTTVSINGLNGLCLPIPDYAPRPV